MNSFDSLKVPKYVRLMLELKQQIDSGELKAGDPLPTREKLMRDHGLSLSTVTRAISELERQGWLISRQGSGTFVARRTTPNQEESQESALVGLLIPHGMYGAHNLLDELIQEGAQQNIRFLVMMSHTDEETELNMGRTLLDTGVKGLLWFPLEPKRHISVASLFRKNRIPVVMGERVLEDQIDIPCVRSDHYTGARSVFEWLLSIGHRQIVYMGPRASEADFGPVPQRWNAYRDAMRNVDQWEPDQLNLHPGILREWDRYRDRVVNLFTGPNAPTALVGFTDHIALEMIGKLNRMNKRVPEDVSVVGFGDRSGGAYSSPRLTSVSFCMQEYVDAIVRVLMEDVQASLAGAASRVEIETVIPQRIVQRESTLELSFSSGRIS